VGKLTARSPDLLVGEDRLDAPPQDEEFQVSGFGP